jgi:hypothetical protein
MNKKEMAEIFGRCSRLLNKVALKTEDEFFSRLCAEEADKLLSEFVFLLRGEYFRVSAVQREKLQGQDAAKNGGAEKLLYVAQCEMRLALRIEKILSLLNILKHLGLIKPPTSLLLEKNLLLLKLALLDVFKIKVSKAQITREKKERVTSSKEKKTLPVLSKPKPNQIELGKSHRKVLEFIKSKGRVQNTEVFSQFRNFSRRTVKKKLSELARAKMIKREAEGKKVFYSVLLPNEPEQLPKNRI